MNNRQRRDIERAVVALLIILQGPGKARETLTAAELRTAREAHQALNEALGRNL